MADGLAGLCQHLRQHQLDRLTVGEKAETDLARKQFDQMIAGVRVRVIDLGSPMYGVGLLHRGAILSVAMR